MKKLLVLFCLLSVFVFSSCINVVQEISYSNGKYKFDYTVTVNKMLLALTEDDWEHELDDLFDIEDELPSNANFRKVDYGDNVGVKFDFEIDEHFSSMDEKRMLPRRKGSLIYIPLAGGETFSGQRASDNWEDLLTEAILEDYKWTVYVQKNIVKSISQVRVVGDDGAGEKVSFKEEKKFFRIDIPISKILDEKNDYTQIAIWSY